MGCLFSKPSSASGSQKNQESPKGKDSETSQPKQYSWDKRDKVDPKDFTIENLKGETAGRLPGTVNGQQFIIQNCEDCNIYIFDHTATVSVDDCVNCRIYIGPIKSSVFIRDCKNCKFMIACQQFRTRDCQRIDVFLSCVTQPIIEATTGAKFGCFQLRYPQIETQFQKAGISPYNNNWSNIHDFTPVADETNFTLLSSDAAVTDFIPLPPPSDQFSAIEVSTGTEDSFVPVTLGKRPKPSEDSCLVVFFNDGLAHDCVKRFMLEMKTNHAGCILVQSKELSMPAEDGLRVFGNDSYSSALKQGPVIGFEYNGDAVCQACQETCVAVCQGTTSLVFVSTNASTASTQIDNFYSFADMQMGI